MKVGGFYEHQLPRPWTQESDHKLLKNLQKSHSPLWMACSNRNSILQAAHHGVGALAFSFVSADEARPWVEEYYRVIENESDPIGYSVNPNFAIACPFLCDRDGDRL